jgi:hypothetical protein
MSKLGLIFRRSVAGIMLLSVVDCSATSGRYGGEILDRAGQNEGANVYRATGRLMNGLLKFGLWGAKQSWEDYKEFSDKHGRPQP